jgi:hypothetical protein
VVHAAGVYRSDRDRGDPTAVQRAARVTDVTPPPCAQPPCSLRQKGRGLPQRVPLSRVFTRSRGLPDCVWGTSKPPDRPFNEPRARATYPRLPDLALLQPTLVRADVWIADNDHAIVGGHGWEHWPRWLADRCRVVDPGPCEGLGWAGVGVGEGWGQPPGAPSPQMIEAGVRELLHGPLRPTIADGIRTNVTFISYERV